MLEGMVGKILRLCWQLRWSGNLNPVMGFFSPLFPSLYGYSDMNCSLGAATTTTPTSGTTK